MALRKAGSGQEDRAPAEISTLETLLVDLKSPEAQVRRRAILQMDRYPESSDVLLDLVENSDDRLTEQDGSVREAIFTTLVAQKNDSVLPRLVRLLSSEDANLRNEAVVAMQSMPDRLGEYIEPLLRHPDSDVRILTINILEGLCDDRTPAWLYEIVQHDPHINVCATALDLLGELGQEHMIPAILALPTRFNNDVYLGFTADVAVRRILGK